MTTLLNQDQVYYIHRLFSQLSSILLESDISWWLTGGTLLGAVRCGGMIAHDDDVDIMMPLSQKEIFIELCESKLKFMRLELKRPSNKYLKVIHPEWKGVWIDCCFCDEHGTDIRGHKANRRYLEDEIFPLRYTQFSTFRRPLPIPCKSEEYLDRVFKNWRTEIAIYNHADHKRNKQVVPLTPELNKCIVYHYK